MAAETPAAAAAVLRIEETDVDVEEKQRNVVVEQPEFEQHAGPEPEPASELAVVAGSELEPELEPWPGPELDEPELEHGLAAAAAVVAAVVASAGQVNRVGC